MDANGLSEGLSMTIMEIVIANITGLNCNRNFNIKEKCMILAGFELVVITSVGFAL
jgi:hypothetical protein